MLYAYSKIVSKKIGKAIPKTCLCIANQRTSFCENLSGKGGTTYLIITNLIYNDFQKFKR